jgi:hypothetical protein
MILELIICCFLVFAVAYWAALWTAGRREDVLHGHFVETEPETDASVVLAAAAPAGVSPPPVFPKKPAIVAAPAPSPAQPAPPPAQAKESDSLQSLLASIKHELKNAAQI